MLADWRGAPSHPTARVHIPTVGCVLVDGKARSHLARRAEGQLVQINLRVTDSIPGRSLVDWLGHSCRIHQLLETLGRWAWRIWGR
jgi:hypothetical protein